MKANQGLSHRHPLSSLHSLLNRRIKRTVLDRVPDGPGGASTVPARRQHRDGWRLYGAASGGAPNRDDLLGLIERTGNGGADSDRATNEDGLGYGGGWTGRRDDGGAAGRCPGGSDTNFRQFWRDGDNRLRNGMVDQAENCFSESLGKGNEYFWELQNNS